MHILNKEKKILRFEKELYTAHKKGFIFRFVPLEEVDSLSGTKTCCGTEILFSNLVTQEQISKIQAYILTVYGFELDDTLCEDINILIVRY